MKKEEENELELSDFKEENDQNDDTSSTNSEDKSDAEFDKSTKVIRNKNPTKRVLLDTPVNDLLIQKFFAMVCEICTEPLQSFAHAKNHFQSIHQRTVSLRCCQKPFTKLYRMVQHCRWHEDPNAFRFEYTTKLKCHTKLYLIVIFLFALDVSNVNVHFKMVIVYGNISILYMVQLLYSTVKYAYINFHQNESMIDISENFTMPMRKNDLNVIIVRKGTSNLIIKILRE